ncbi:MAG: PEP-CTERM sorting domain-containing protein [Deltaproteobacteria bacterium]|nr:PEP-CTERM sorting domain-containing protein [Deltaproteobacteria bacterium]
MKRKSCLAVAAFLAAGFTQADAFAAQFSYGDVFASVNNGQVRHYGADGTLLETLNTGVGGLTTGLGFDPGGNLYVSNHTNGSITRFSADEVHSASQFGVNLSIKKPEGIIFDNSGNLWVGSGCCGDIKKLDSNGNNVFSLNTGRRADWIQLNQDESKIYYSEDVHNGIKTIDIATGAHETPLSSRYGFAQFQLLPDGGIIAAHKGTVKKLDSLGRLVASYDVAGVDKWFALDLDTDIESFWAGSYQNDTLYRFDIATGTVLQTIDTGLGGEHLYGVAVYTGGQPQLASLNTKVPEPATMSLLALTATGLFFSRRRSRNS